MISKTCAECFIQGVQKVGIHVLCIDNLHLNSSHIRISKVERPFNWCTHLTLRGHINYNRIHYLRWNYLWQNYFRRKRWFICDGSTNSSQIVVISTDLKKLNSRLATTSFSRQRGLICNKTELLPQIIIICVKIFTRRK